MARENPEWVAKKYLHGLGALLDAHGLSRFFGHLYRTRYVTCHLILKYMGKFHIELRVSVRERHVLYHFSSMLVYDPLY
jgi:hypothetical protein